WAAGAGPGWRARWSAGCRRASPSATLRLGPPRSRAPGPRNAAALSPRGEREGLAPPGVRTQGAGDAESDADHSAPACRTTNRSAGRTLLPRRSRAVYLTTTRPDEKRSNSLDTAAHRRLSAAPGPPPRCRPSSEEQEVEP